jgi:ribosomal protein L11 methylase PrmA
MAEERSVSVSELKEILAAQQRLFSEQTAALVAEMRKPTVLEQKELDKQNAEILAKNQERKENAAGMKAKRDADKWTKHTCNHMHPKGDTHCVYIQPTKHDRYGYILCQKNQCIIRPEPAPVNYDGDDIYDTQQFNRLMQTLPSNELFQ